MKAEAERKHRASAKQILILFAFPRRELEIVALLTEGVCQLKHLLQGETAASNRQLYYSKISQRDKKTKKKPKVFTATPAFRNDPDSNINSGRSD